MSNTQLTTDKEVTFKTCADAVEEARDKIQQYEYFLEEQSDLGRDTEDKRKITTDFLKNLDSFISGMKQVFGQ